MADDIRFAVKVFAALFAIMNPIANVPIFLPLTEGGSDAQRHRTAVVAIIAVGIGCVVSALAGGAVLSAFGLTVDDFRLAGGLMVLLIALSMLNGSASAQHKPADHEIDGTAPSVAIYPLAVPLLVGPGTIATLIVFGHAAISQGLEIGLALGLGGFLVVLAAALLTAPWLGHHLSAQATAVTRRLMGMLLAAIAVEMMTTSIRALFLSGR
ncbi:MarC family protein [Paracoccus denitrificans]|jgi:multiple antibiotic resistance protein|uniref:UPF0056 inner membrane protein n=1 Tax=Paracoccus denitrificans (strain Pd 1222) TaxID=318586 RepID=A1B985_PARDP|nr:MarC family protein [Paracoccus denitrificans]ABL72079.1 multiple antibiotic resistance (MarC)-related protein [Paracoccus denitrificans PD1222]MBB4626011.1 multiple antibiotic resistance protein [Paracoccus denitrificans]MCU7426829.1 MarC family protein [Paracoccus denitrificans]QAR28658.1 MarC family protein [Paracoccus denitrificans]UPV96802.1 MarC family protein [Paracoccus denitrificans]